MLIYFWKMKNIFGLSGKSVKYSFWTEVSISSGKSNQTLKRDTRSRWFYIQLSLASCFRDPHQERVEGDMVVKDGGKRLRAGPTRLDGG